MYFGDNCHQINVFICFFTGDPGYPMYLMAIFMAIMFKMAIMRTKWPNGLLRPNFNMAIQIAKKGGLSKCMKNSAPL